MNALDKYYRQATTTTRRHFKFVQNLASKINKITCGVPQGSTLGPLFFYHACE